MKQLQAGLAIVLWVSAAVSGATANTTGPLNVSTSVQATCSAPSPDGTLVLPFESGAGFPQAFSSEVHVTVSCTGGASVDEIAIGWGQRYDDVNNIVYRMLNNRGTLGVGPALLDDACLEYELWYKDESANAGTQNIYNESTVDYIQGINNNDIFIYGRVIGGLTSSSSPCDSEETDATQMPAGSYNDVVTLTVKFS